MPSCFVARQSAFTELSRVQEPMPVPSDIRVAAHEAGQGGARLKPWWGVALLNLGAATAAAGMAWGLSHFLAPLGSAAPAMAAAIGILLILIPLLALLVKLARQNERAQQMLARLDTLDSLTGVATRAHFMALVEREWSRARRYGGGAGIVIVELDRFKRICELRGATAGDAVLRELAGVVGKSLRGADALARFGPSQFVVFLAQADPMGALDVAERIRERVELLEVPWQEQRLRVSATLGVATLRPAHVHLHALMQDAETALDAARFAGGNCVRSAPIDSLEPAPRDASLGKDRSGPV